MDRDSIIGIALLIIIALILVNYLNTDCASVMDRGATVKQGYEEPERKRTPYRSFPAPSMESAPERTGRQEGDSGSPGGRPPIPRPPGPTPPGP